MIIGKKGNQNSGVEYGDIRPGLISRRVKKKGVEGKNCGRVGAKKGRGEICGRGGGRV